VQVGIDTVLLIVFNCGTSLSLGRYPFKIPARDGLD